MNNARPETVTRLLQDVRAGEVAAVDSLAAIAYSELGGLARRYLSAEDRGHTLQPTALIHEAWLKLASHLGSVDDRRHFFAVASTAMRQVLTDHARKSASVKRGGRNARVALDPFASADADGFDVVDLDDSLRRLAGLNPRHARVVELRVFGALSIAETAETLGVSHGTVESDWFTAKAWLRKELGAAQ